MIVEFNIMTVLILTCYVRPEPEQNVLLASKFVKNISLGHIALRGTLVGIFLIFLNFSRAKFSMHIHEFEVLCANFVILLNFNLSQDLNVSIAPNQHIVIIHGLSFAKLVLH